MNSEEALQRLREGNARFVQDNPEGKQRDSVRREELLPGQKPFAILLSCADSRVVPELTFDTGLGELFVVRVAGNVANPSSLASIEYAVAHLGPQLIVVLGHENCGAVTAAIGGGDNGPNLNHLLGFISPVVNSSEDQVNEVVRKNAKHAAAELANNSEILNTSLAEGGLEIVSAYYNLGSGKVEFD